MTAGSYGYGSMRATDADRENVRQVLQDAHARGRLSWDELDSRTSALLNAQTYSQLAELTADLPGQVPGTAPQMYQQQSFAAQSFGQPFGVQRSTNGMAIAALICGVCQIFFWFLTGIPAIVFGHLARRQIRQTGEAGDGMALTGMILGYVGVALSVLTVVIFVILAVAISHRVGNPQPPLPVPPGP
ncbi:MAG TPA: DUF1707 and DUF4190 domain-containing protein [Streptosporangiaceae bacterium]|nr:DUF1707 and DUF4190 domain-containing protein [Streptosporangiaceae bacterium]